MSSHSAFNLPDLFPLSANVFSLKIHFFFIFLLKYTKPSYSKVLARQFHLEWNYVAIVDLGLAHLHRIKVPMCFKILFCNLILNEIFFLFFFFTLLCLVVLKLHSLNFLNPTSKPDTVWHYRALALGLSRDMTLGPRPGAFGTVPQVHSM